jgi:hypothetical protein
VEQRKASDGREFFAFGNILCDTHGKSRPKS